MKLEIYRRADGLYAWRLKAANGRIIATDGGQGYAARRACRESAGRALGEWRIGARSEIRVFHLYPIAKYRTARDLP